MIRTIKLYSILSTFILASCVSNNIDGVDWNVPSSIPSYAFTSPNEIVILNNDEWLRPPPPPQITPPSAHYAPNFTPTNKPNFIPPPPPLFNFVIDFGE